jgi:hypothetical protein
LKKIVVSLAAASALVGLLTGCAGAKPDVTPTVTLDPVLSAATEFVDLMEVSCLKAMSDGVVESWGDLQDGQRTVMLPFTNADIAAGNEPGVKTVSEAGKSLTTSVGQGDLDSCYVRVALAAAEASSGAKSLVDLVIPQDGSDPALAVSKNSDGTFRAAWSGVDTVSTYMFSKGVLASVLKESAGMSAHSVVVEYGAMTVADKALVKKTRAAGE